MPAAVEVGETFVRMKNKTRRNNPATKKEDIMKKCRESFTTSDFNRKLSFTLRFSRNLCQSQFVMNDRPVENSIQKKLQSGLKPIHLKIINESYMHNVPKGSETHFKVFVVSQEFENIDLLKRHRLVNSLLEEESQNGVHALSIVAKAPSQWNPDEEITPSPKCLGGFGK